MGARVTFGMVLTLLAIVSALALMVTTRASPDVILLAAVVLLSAAGVMAPRDALSGFANPGMLTVAALFVVAAGLRETGAIGLMTRGLLGRPKTVVRALGRMIPPVLVGSAFLNNTTVVASMMPAVHDWSRRIGLPASKVLMPLSFASILGGTCTLIGTSTNLVVAGLVADNLNQVPGLREVGMLDISLLGVPIAVAGAGILTLLSPWLLQDRRPAVSLGDDPREYTIELLVPDDSRLIGRSIEEAGLRHLPGAFLMEINRGDRVLPAVAAHQVLEADDRLIFVGDVDAMVDLQRLPGLSPASDQVFQLEDDREQRILAEAVVSNRNPVVGRTIREASFRTRYHAVVIAVARAGERIPGRIGDIVLQPGDVLLLEVRTDFVVQQRSRTDFYLVSEIAGARPARTGRAYVAMGILAVLVVSVAMGWVSTVIAAMVAAGLMVLTRCCTLEEARRSLDLQVLVAISAALGLGHAMQETGLSVVISDTAFALGATDPLRALIVLYVVTAVVTELVTNNAAAVLALPLAFSMAERLDVSPMAFVFTVMIAASASFLTPMGYQTNLMVYGPGGYRFTDYARLGLPLSLTAGLLTVLLAPVWWPFR